MEVMEDMVGRRFIGVIKMETTSDMLNDALGIKALAGMLAREITSSVRGKIPTEYVPIGVEVVFRFTVCPDEPPAGIEV